MTLNGYNRLKRTILFLLLGICYFVEVAIWRKYVAFVARVIDKSPVPSY